MEVLPPFEFGNVTWSRVDQSDVFRRWRETDVPSQSFSPKSAVKYLHVGRRKIQISPPLGEQDQSNALPQGQQKQSNPHPLPCLPPAGFTLIGALYFSKPLFEGLIFGGAYV